MDLSTTAGAAAIVMHCLFEEQIERDELGLVHGLVVDEPRNSEALAHFPSSECYTLAPDDYLEQLRRVKSTVAVPVIASLNGMTWGGWLRYAELLQDDMARKAAFRAIRQLMDRTRLHPAGRQ